jgi:large subunit ribosomal protein L17
MTVALFKHKRITTTVAKAKALRKYVEPLITKSKEDTTHSRRVVFSYLQDKEAIKELFGVISSKVAERPGGYTRIIKLGHRADDGSDMCFIELVDFDENMLKAAGKKTRTRRGGKKVAAPKAEEVAPAEEAPVVEETPAEEVAAPAEETPAEEPAPAEEAPAEEEAPKAE